MNLNNPDEVKELSMKINNAVRNLTNIKGIIHETNMKKDRAKVVKDEANLVKYVFFSCRVACLNLK